MAQIAKLEVETEIKSSAEKFYDVFRSKAYLMPKICPNFIKSIQILQGDWSTVGSVRLWTYVAGNSETVKDTIEGADEKSKSITFNMLEGEILTYYKTYKPTIQVTKKGSDDDGSLVKWSVEYEKQNDDIPAPHKYLEFLAILSKSVDKYLQNA